MKIDKDLNLLIEAYADVNKAKASEWYKQYLPYGYQEINKNTYVGNDNGREFVTWFVPNEGEMTYDYYLVYKDEGKKHWIDEEVYNKITNK